MAASYRYNRNQISYKKRGCELYKLLNFLKPCDDQFSGFLKEIRSPGFNVHQAGQHFFHINDVIQFPGL